MIQFGGNYNPNLLPSTHMNTHLTFPWLAGTLTNHFICTEWNDIDCVYYSPTRAIDTVCNFQTTLLTDCNWDLKSISTNKIKKRVSETDYQLYLLYHHFQHLDESRTCVCVSVCVCVCWAAEGVCVGQGDMGRAAAAYASTCSSVWIELEGLGWSRPYCAE